MTMRDLEGVVQLCPSDQETKVTMARRTPQGAVSNRASRVSPIIGTVATGKIEVLFF